MTLQQLLNNVIEVTRRPDARARALLALNTIISEIVTDYDYPEDLIEETVLYQADSNQVVIPSPTTKPIRSIAWLQIRGITLQQSTVRAISQMPCPPINVYYRSGTSLVINTSWDSFSELRIGYYPVPDYLTEEDGFNTTWLLDKYPALLENGTIGRVFQATGDDASAGYYEGLYMRMRGQIRRAQLED